MTAITPCLWFDDDAAAAAELYLSLFPDAERITTVHHPDDPAALGPNADKAGTVLLEKVKLAGTTFTLLNGGPMFPQTEAVSFEISCADQAEVDYFWHALISDGGSESRCGWCKDRFGVSWQVVPERFYDLMSDPDPDVVSRVSTAMYGMGRLVVADLERAAAG